MARPPPCTSKQACDQWVQSSLPCDVRWVYSVCQMCNPQNSLHIRQVPPPDRARRAWPPLLTPRLHPLLRSAPSPLAPAGPPQPLVARPVALASPPPQQPARQRDGRHHATVPLRAGASWGRRGRRGIHFLDGLWVVVVRCRPIQIRWGAKVGARRRMGAQEGMEGEEEGMGVGTTSTRI
ncbi:hypothetical protein DFH06DRAFT_54408 [Mycena polygramma]|nr:hypothetical protein DFH06DRAFT_54408 [Mycena polygramma]